MLLTFDVTISESIDFTDDKRHTLDYTGKYILWFNKKWESRII